MHIKQKIATPLLTLNSNVHHNWFHCSQRDCLQKKVFLWGRTIQS